jgi:16S rRNA (guanine527-N7)-methyltransferase
MKSSPKFRIQSWFPELDDQVVSRLATYHKELLRFNNTINLISARTIDDADAIHFADSIIGAKLVFGLSSSSEIYDIGSGNGFPGLVMAAMSPGIELVLVDSDRRKCEFLKHTANAMNLDNVTVRTIRIESIAAESVETGVCRAFAHLPKTLLITRKIFVPGGNLFNFKGNEWSFEIAQLPEQLCSTWNTELIEEYRLPAGEAVHSIVRAQKK